jgi:hypothetical protein
MIRGPNQNVNPSMCTVITTAPLDRVNEYHGPHREIEMTRAKVRREDMERLKRATDPEIIDEQRVNMNRRQTPITANVPRSPQSPRSKSSASVEIVEGPKPEVIDLSIDEIETMFMDDVTQQTTQAEAQAKADSDTEEGRDEVASLSNVRRRLIPTSLQHARVHLVQIWTRVGD